MIDRLQQQIDFIVEMDKLKQIFRQSYLVDQSRRENDAEHSWHLALMALLLAEYAAEPVNLFRVVKMVILHDLVEVDAGDTCFYDEQGTKDKAEREQKAADRIFSMLPAEQGVDLRAAWEEFEAKQTAEARFAAALDRLEPLLLDTYNKGDGWHKHGMTLEKVLERNRHIAKGSPALWEFAQGLIQKVFSEGSIPKAE
jgi:putative hydrolases of HD superfamily